MSDSEDLKKPVGMEPDMKIEENTTGNGIPRSVSEVMDEQQEQAASASDGGLSRRSKRISESPIKVASGSDSPAVNLEKEEVIGGDITLKLEPGKAPKLSRSMSQKVIARPPQMFSHLEDSTQEAKSTFEIMADCVYAAKYLGSTEHALECDCAEEWDAESRTNHACGEDSDCINRATKMECIGDCGCGAGCQNQRFQQKQYANVSVIKTEKKGYGLRANQDLKADEFIFEYIGDVIGETAFRRRMLQYDEEGIKHFYFMSLTKGEFVDATKRGNLGRFCNHSCNPNCYVDKWVVGDKLRMGIFAERKIQAGEELVFNYNVDRYGAEPQPCYCGEPNCTGYIGGKTQTERATKLSHATIEALGIDDGDGWDTAVAKKPRKKKTGEDDEEYVNNVEPKGLDESGVTKVMAALMQCKEKWIAVKLLSRLQRAEDEKVCNRVVKMHGYRILNTALTTWMEDDNIILQIFDILDRLPRLTRNKIQDSKIEETVEKLQKSEDERVRTQAVDLLSAWSKLEVAYRIPRVKRDPNAVVPDRRPDRPDRRESGRGRSRSRSRSKSPDMPKAPSGPRSNVPQRSFARAPFRPRPPHGPLPPGWFEAVAQNGSTYYYNASGATTWQRPTLPAMGAPPPPPPKAISDQQRLQELIANIVASKDTKKEQPSASATPTDTPKRDKKEEKWRSLPEEKQKKLYEHTLQPSIMYVMGKFKGKLDRDELKKFAKELAKKLVNSDFKNNRVTNPNEIDTRKERAVKKYAKEYFDRVVDKKREHEKKKADKAKQASGSASAPASDNADANTPMDLDPKDDEVVLTDNEDDDPPIADPIQSPNALKRRLEELGGADLTPNEATKRIRTDATATAAAPPPPPPPPPPPADADADTDMAEAGLTPHDDVSGSFTTEALEAVAANGAAADGLGSAYENGTDKPSPMQVATPPTTGSPYRGEEDRGRKQGFSGMNPERMRSLGLDGEGGGA